MVYNLIPSFNATVNDVEYPVAYTVIATLIVYVLMFAPFVFPIKTWYSMLGKPGKYSTQHLQADYGMSVAMVVCLVAVYISSWVGYANILALYRPNDEANPFMLIPRGQDTFWLVVSSLITAYFLCLIIYRGIMLCYAPTGSKSISEAHALERKSVTNTNLTVPEGTANDELYWEKVDKLQYKSSIVFRIFCTVLIVFSLMLFVTIYPYTVNRQYLVNQYFFVTAQFQLTSGILLTFALAYGLVSGVWQRKTHDYDTYVARLFNNTDVISHSYANSFYGFSFAGHMTTIEVGKWWIISFIAFMFNVIYTITCSVEKAQTFFVAVLLVVLVGTCLAQRRGAFLPFLLAALWPYSTVPYLVEFTNPPNATDLIGQPQINTNYLTTAADCTVGKMDEDGTLIFGLSIFAFATALFAVFDVTMAARGSKMLPSERKERPLLSDDST
jgi:hypothetical protein